MCKYIQAYACTIIFIDIFRVKYKLVDIRGYFKRKDHMRFIYNNGNEK